MIEVVLTPFELSLGKKVGDMRFMSAVKNKRPNRYGKVKDAHSDWDISVVGALGELGVAKGLNRWWSSPYLDVLDKELPDVGERIQVRSRVAHKGVLYLHPGDVDDHWYVLITGQAPTMQIWGGILGKDGKRDEWWREPQPGRPCFCVPHQNLIPAEELKKIAY